MSKEPPVLPVVDIGTTVDADGVRWPTAVVDASHNPEVADLARVHATDGVGDVSTEALCLPWAEGHLFLLGVRITTPVTCAFAMAFSLPAQREVLDDAAEAGQLVIATTPPEDAATHQPLWLALDLDTTAFRDALP